MLDKISEETPCRLDFLYPHIAWFEITGGIADFMDDNNKVQ